jgi:hypothetical protein
MQTTSEVPIQQSPENHQHVRLPTWTRRSAFVVGSVTTYMERTFERTETLRPDGTLNGRIKILSTWRFILFWCVLALVSGLVAFVIEL